jgi:hypothetical protein
VSKAGPAEAWPFGIAEPRTAHTHGVSDYAGVPAGIPSQPSKTRNLSSRKGVDDLGRLPRLPRLERDDGATNL